MENPRTLVLLYQYFYPDEVISARLYADLAEEMVARGWRVVAMPACRVCHGDARLKRKERWNGVDILRVWRPGFKQSTFFGRIFNALFMLMGWSWRALTFPRTKGEVMIVGTDPILGVLAAIPWRLFRRKSIIIHWCHDLHPEAIIADGSLKEGSWLDQIIRTALRWAYGSTDRIVDLGSCMRSHLISYTSTQTKRHRHQTITPWALVEPNTIPVSTGATKQTLFGSVRLGCLYSGNLGRAHEFEPFLALARKLDKSVPGTVGFCFAGRGPRFKELQSQLVESDANIHLADFANENELQDRLAAADVHLVSLRPNWTGTVVPSKFFGALAIGRPVLFAGSADSAIARWITDYNIGWHLTGQSLDSIAAELLRYAADPDARSEMQRHCFEVYGRYFSKSQMMNRWAEVLGMDSISE